MYGTLEAGCVNLDLSRVVKAVQAKFCLHLFVGKMLAENVFAKIITEIRVSPCSESHLTLLLLSLTAGLNLFSFLC